MDSHLLGMTKLCSCIRIWQVPAMITLGVLTDELLIVALDDQEILDSLMKV